jgi:hypothetical protein
MNKTPKGIQRRWPAVGLVILTMAHSVESGAQQSCRLTGQAVSVGDVPEASGIAVSRRTAGVLWSHNDSGEPTLFALSTDGTTLGRVYVSGASGNWEDIAIGPCPQGSCIYIGDIGDNSARRREVFIYRVPEPDSGATVSGRAETMRVRYPDGPRDAEALIVLPDGKLFIVSKGELGAVALYRAPSFQNGASVQLERVATLVEAEGGNTGRVGRPDRVTGAGSSPDGRWIVLRTLYALTFYNAATFATGNTGEAFRFLIRGVREQQGEGVAIGDDGTVWLASEGGGNKQPGIIARLSCTLP